MNEQIKFDGLSEPLSPEEERLMKEKEITCCFTGHRNIQHTPMLYADVRTTILRAYDMGFRNFCAGGAIGFDTIAALTVLALRTSTHGDLRLSLVLPYPDQHASWSKENKHLFEQVLDGANSIEYASDHFHSSCMMIRNRRLVDLSSLCIAYLTELKSGTGYTVKYARKKGIRVVNLA